MLARVALGPRLARSARLGRLAPLAALLASAAAAPTTPATPATIAGVAALAGLAAAALALGRGAARGGEGRERRSGTARSRGESLGHLRSLDGGCAHACVGVPPPSGRSRARGGGGRLLGLARLVLLRPHRSGETVPVLLPERALPVERVGREELAGVILVLDLLLEDEAAGDRIREEALRLVERLRLELAVTDDALADVLEVEVALPSLELLHERDELGETFLVHRLERRDLERVERGRGGLELLGGGAGDRADVDFLRELLAGETGRRDERALARGDHDGLDRGPVDERGDHPGEHLDRDHVLHDLAALVVELARVDHPVHLGRLEPVRLELVGEPLGELLPVGVSEEGGRLAARLRLLDEELGTELAVVHVPEAEVDVLDIDEEGDLFRVTHANKRSPFGECGAEPRKSTMKDRSSKRSSETNRTKEAHGGSPTIACDAPDALPGS